MVIEITEISDQSSSSSSSSSYKYDVFLSFRGEDTRYNFTDHLLKALQEATIETFFDDAEIQIGDVLKPELENAIMSSKASIIVLSKNYASSTWCLDELALIMDQQRTSKHVVYPIFYHVNPSDVQKQRNSFGEAMAEHDQRMETESDAEKRSEWAEKIEKWKKALTEVADIKGKEANGSRLFETQVPPNHTKHFLQGLSHKESIQLLSWHAFGRNEPNVGYKEKSMMVVEYCQGHPLALKVLGCSLRIEDATWEDILESLGKEIYPDVKKVLKISFDTLPSEKDKELSKYIACLFVGEDRKSTEDILKACGLCKPSGVNILINRCLLVVDNSNELMMHQLLQDMGREIVRQESPKEPWKHSILWHHEECLDVLQNKQGTPTIQALVLDMKHRKNQVVPICKNSHLDKFKWVHILLSVIWWLFGWVSGMYSSFQKSKGDFETVALSEMPNLLLLQLNYIQSSGSYKNFPQDLRWLCMHGFHMSYIPSDIQMENMVALDMSYSKLQQLWKTPKLLKSLKFLNLSSCHELVRVGHFSGLPLLERLTLAGCTSLVEICDTIGAYCQKLEVLDLSNCSKLKELPRSIGKLNNLIQLSIDGCSNIGDNINMKSHESSSSTMVPRSSNFFMSSLPRSLVTLSLKNCNLYNESFPMDFSGLSILKKLYLDGNPIDSMPDCVRSLSRLETLSFSRCGNLKTVMCAPIQLNHLEIDSCQSLERVTFNPELSSIPYITYYRTLIALTEIEHKFKIQALSEVDEEVLRSLGWISIAYLNHCRLSMANWIRMYDLERRIRIVPAQMLYEHGIFSTYLQGKEVPEWFTQRSSGSSFTLQSPPENGKIKGINVCIVRTISSMKEADPWRIKIRNLTKNSSWSYQPRIYLVPEKDAFEDGGEVDVIWLSHWMFGKNEFEDGDQVSIHFTVKYFYGEGVLGGVRYEPCVKVREYGMSTVYDDGGKQKKEDPLGYYKSWKYIIGGDLSPFEDFPSNYFLYSWRSILDFPLG